MHKIILLFFLLFATSCATIFTGSKDPISFYSEPPNASVYVDGNYYGNTPLEVKIDRKYRDMEVKIEKDGYVSSSFLLSKKFNAVSLLNLLTFGVDGFLFSIVDIATGNVLKYKNKYYNSKLIEKNPQQKKQQEPKQENNDYAKEPVYNIIGTGTGFVISSEGYIVTNYHVIKKANKIELFFPSEGDKFSKYTAVDIAHDENNDIAILKITDSKYNNDLKPQYKFEYNYSIAENVYTIGYPTPLTLGQDYKVTNGIISALSGPNENRAIMQIQVPLQPGNSGGPLFNKYGNIVGITSAKINDSYYIKQTGTIAQNVNYAIKIDHLKPLIKDLTNIKINENNPISNLEITDQVKVNKNFVCLIAVYE